MERAFSADARVCDHSNVGHGSADDPSGDRHRPPVSQPGVDVRRCPGGSRHLGDIGERRDDRETERGCRLLHDVVTIILVIIMAGKEKWPNRKMFTE